MNRNRIAALLALLLAVCCAFAADRAAAQQLYWSQFNPPPLVGRVNLDGTGSVTLPQANQVFGMETVDSTRQVYWIDFGANSIMRSNADFTGVVPLVTGLGAPQTLKLNLAADPAANLVFWTDSQSQAIGRASLSGGPVLGTFGTPDFLPDDVAVDPVRQFVYWTQQSGHVVRARYDGTNQSVVLNLDGIGTSGLDVDAAAGKIYVSHTNAHRILRANLDGSGLETLLNTLERPFGMELFNGRMYWTDLDAGRLRSANLDGSDVQTILGGLSAPRQVSIMNVPEPSAAALYCWSLVAGFYLRRHR